MSGDLRDRLRRLRREGGEAPPKPSGDLPSWLKRRLAEDTAEVDDERSGARTAGRPSGCEDARSDAGPFAAREETYPAAHVHGTWRLDEVDHALAPSIARIVGDPALDGLDLRRAVYLDIETTGLSGGAGTIPFLVALGTFDSVGDPVGDPEGGFTMWQGFLDGPEQECAMLAEVARRVDAADSVVSFFGKSFDRHRLEDKMRLHGIEPPFEGRPHLDLFHPLNRLYREAFPDGRLATMETRLCGVERDDDLPGKFAPEAWFDFLAGRAHRLDAVFQHNRDDVLSLVVLAAHLGRSMEERRSDGSVLEGPDWARASGLARLFAARREREEALVWVQHAIDRRDEVGRALLVLRADLWRLTGDWERARPEYERLADEGRDEAAVHCLVELAKLLEHKARERDAALAAVERARALLERAVRGSAYARFQKDLERRAERLSTCAAGSRGRADSSQQPAE